MEQKILSSASYRSFQSEREVVGLFRDTAWTSTHGFYYDDPQTQKKRELDVVARQVWTSRVRGDDWVCRLTALVEVKSMSGFHLLLSPGAARAEGLHEHIKCAADSTGKYKDLARHCRLLGISHKDIDSLARRAHEYAYPEGHARLWAQMIRPQPLMSFTSFRETSFGSDKELDNSVFWRASRNLRSAQVSISEKMASDYMHDMVITADFDHIKDDWVEGMWSTFSRYLSAVDIIHPVVVTDAQLWAVDEDGPKKCKYARFCEQSYDGATEWWCDLVNADHLAEYVVEASSHYASRLLAEDGVLGR